MLKKQITFEDLETGQPVTQEFYFNLSKSELVEMEVTADGGYEASMQRIVEAKDGKAIMAEFKRFILASVGEKTEQGGFRKSQELRDRFEESPAYSELFMELVTDSEAGAKFLGAIVPQQLGNRLAEVRNERARQEAQASHEAETGRTFGKSAKEISDEFARKQEEAKQITPVESEPLQIVPQPIPDATDPGGYTVIVEPEPQRNVFDQQQAAPMTAEEASNMSIEEFRARVKRDARREMGLDIDDDPNL